MDKRRFYLIDSIRGISLISMVLYHFCFDVFEVYALRPGWAFLPLVHIWQQSICWTFILVSGYVWSFGKKTNLKRGIIINVFGLIITLVTVIVIPSEAIWFGILTFIGCAILLMLPLEKLLLKIPAGIGIVLSFLLFEIFRDIDIRLLGIRGLYQISLPDYIYELKIFTPLGFCYSGFASGDYFAIFPWFFLYICGFYLHKIVIKNERLSQIAEMRAPLLPLIGRKTLWVYMIHQPVCMAICYLLFDLLDVF